MCIPPPHSSSLNELVFINKHRYFILMSIQNVSFFIYREVVKRSVLIFYAFHFVSHVFHKYFRTLVLIRSCSTCSDKVLPKNYYFSTNTNFCGKQEIDKNFGVTVTITALFSSWMIQNYWWNLFIYYQFHVKLRLER